jgi:hypothetical protein
LANYGNPQRVLLKIDIEGSEFEVLNPSNSCINQIEYIMGEFHLFAGDPNVLIECLSKVCGFSPVLTNAQGREDLPIIHLAKGLQP